jgi:3-phytase
VPATAETTPVRRYGDAADDPAILLPSPRVPQPLILGTDKREGLAVYTLTGEQIQMLPVGRLNNVDILNDSSFGGRNDTIAAASNRSRNSISIFSTGPGDVTHISDIPTSLTEVYGLCTYSSPSGAYVFINDKDGRYQQYRLGWRENRVTGSLVREFRLPSQPEGCVTDERRGRLYMGEEAVGIWEAGAEPDGDAPVLIISTGDVLTADVEGMGLYQRETSADSPARQLLVVSSQGSDSYVIYDLADGNRPLAHFSIAADLENRIDGVSETDGLAVTAAPLPGFPLGLLVVQDGRNRMPDQPQNFKLVDWRSIEPLLGSGAGASP